MLTVMILYNIYESMWLCSPKPQGVVMSKPSPPYYYKDGSDAYHWEPNCSKNHYPAPGWHKSSEKPTNREQCDECKNK